MNVEGKIVLITGGAGGLGSCIAHTLAASRAVVCILELPQAEEAAGALVQQICEDGGQAAFYPMDITKEEDWKKTVGAVCEKYGRIDVLVGNAGINIRKPIEEMLMEEWMKMMEVNTGGISLASNTSCR